MNEAGRSVVGALKAVFGTSTSLYSSKLVPGSVIGSSYEGATPSARISTRPDSDPSNETQQNETRRVLSCLCTRNEDGVLMISKYAPSAFKDCSWRLSEFTVINKLYSSQISKVYHVQHTASGTDLALKMYKKPHMPHQQLAQAAREASLHSRIEHPNIISLYATWIEDGNIIMCTEYAPIGSAFRKLKKVGRFTEDIAAKFIVLRVLYALQFLHSIGLVHRDIKPENILLTNDGCCLADFGLAINQQDERPCMCLGTFDYMAPELFRLVHSSSSKKFMDQSDPGIESCDEKIDVWALGILCYELMVGKAPFTGKTNAATIRNIITGAEEALCKLSQGGAVSELGVDFMRQCLQWEPAKRPGASELLQHPWITHHCIDAAELELSALSLSQQSITSDILSASSSQSLSAFRSGSWRQNSGLKLARLENEL